MTTDAYTKISLEFEGPNGAQTFVDSCSVPKTLSINGEIHNSTVAYKYGSASAKVSNDAGNDYGYVKTVSASPDFNIGVADYGMSGFIYLLGIYAYGYFTIGELQSSSPSASIQLGIEVDEDGVTAHLRHYVNYIENVSYVIPSLTLNTWHHLAVTRKSGTTRLFLNGSLVATATTEQITTDTDNYKFQTGTSVWGYLDQVEFTKDVARWITDFTPAEYYEYVGPQNYYIEVTDEIDMADDTYGLDVYVYDGINISDLAFRSMMLAQNISDVAYAVDTTICGIAISIQDVIGLSDSATAMLCLLLNEYLTSIDLNTVNQSGTKTLSESLTMFDTAYSALNMSVIDTVAMQDTSTVQLCISILESLGFSELVTAIGNFNHGVSDTVGAKDSLQFGYIQAVSEALGAVDVTDIVRLLLNSVVDELGLADAATNQMTAILPVYESMTLADTISSQGILYNVVYDTLKMNLTVEMDGETWECYVLNTPKFLPSIYSGYDFNSYCVFENRAYGCKSDGIYELTGDTDNGVAFHTGVQLSETKFGMPNQKRFRKAYVGVSGAKPVMVMETEAGLRKAYSIDTDGEVDASRALKSKKWKLAVTDFESLDFIKLIPVVLAK